MKKRYRFIIVAFLLLGSLLVFSQKSPYSKQLKEYRASGVEKLVNARGASPNEIIRYAKTFIGTKHRMGGTSKKGLDCSGLVYVCFSKYGIQLPRSSSEQGRYGKQITSARKLEKGDLVFFHMDWSKSRLVNHVGIYIDDDTFIHVSSSKGCIISDLDSDFWSDSFLFGTRLW